MKISYSWLKSYVPNLPEVEKLADLITYHLAEVEGVEKLESGDTLFDINILPNRAHDLLSHQGMAREVCKLLGQEYKDMTELYTVPESTAANLTIELNTPKCRRYMGRIVRGITIRPSPKWVVGHLESIGQRSINNIVDATNIVMYDIGQPMHAFDAKKLAGEKIVVEEVVAEQIVTLLTGEEKKLLPGDAIISDGAHALAIAGVKGGKYAEVDSNTIDVVLEVANFDPVSVRKTARRIGILTDSAKRFENDLSTTLAPLAMRELSSLILEMCPTATFEDIVDVYPNPVEETRKVSFSLSRINAKLGANLTLAELEKIITSYFGASEIAGDTCTIAVSAMRLDLYSESDIAEEVGRILGYEKLIPAIPKIDFTPKRNETHERALRVRESLLARGYSEVITYAFAKKGKVEVARGAKGAEFLRTNLADGLKKSFDMNRLNAPLLGAEEVPVFEIGNVFPEAGVEEMHVAYADKSGVHECKLADFDFGNAITHISATLVQKDAAADAKFTQWSLFPFIVRDIAVWVPEGTDPHTLVQLFTEQGTELLTGTPRLFDQFTKEKNTSLAFRLVFQSKNRTLTDEDVQPIVENIYSTLKTKGYTVR